MLRLGSARGVFWRVLPTHGHDGGGGRPPLATWALVMGRFSSTTWNAIVVHSTEKIYLHCSLQYVSFSPFGYFGALLLCSVNNCTLLFIFGGFICFSRSPFPRMFRWELKVLEFGPFFVTLFEFSAVIAICRCALKVCAETCARVLFLFPWAVEGRHSICSIEWPMRWLIILFKLKAIA